MLILLPPSETKRSGGWRQPLDVGALALPGLREQRTQVVDALITLARDAEAAARVLRLGASQRGEIAHNRALREAPTMPAIDRYAGVLFGALDARSIDAAGRRWLGAHVLIHSAAFGPVSALDRIPAYRLATGAALPGVPSLRRVWSGPVEAALRDESPRFVLDLRSQAYAALGPVPAGVPSAYVRVLADTGGGTTRALNHFNKHAKGALVRALAEDRPRISRPAALLRWAHERGWMLRPGAPGEFDLLVTATTGSGDMAGSLSENTQDR